MQYRKDEKSGNNLSVLGFGCMRLPQAMGRINMEKAEILLMQAYEQGVNYFDTAYIYPGSEEAVGKIFEKRGIREKIYIATKLPHFACNRTEDFDKYFNIHKKRLRTNYIDYYLIHNINNYAEWEKLCNIGIKEWIAAKKASGEIRQIGFSFHGSQEDFYRMLDAYDWEFVQIQYNYINKYYQAGMAGLKRAAEKGIPVIIMEPLLGGKLAGNLPEKAAELFQKVRPDSTPVSWALRWLWNQSEVTLLLSGMNEISQLEENLKLAEQAFPDMLNEEEEKTILEVEEIFNKSYKIRCTGCNYCMPCPKGINIPACFTAYNSSYVVGWGAGIAQYITSVGGGSEKPHYVSDCVQCGKCEKHCPQEIKIRKEFKNVKRRLELPGLKVIMGLFRKVMK